MSSRDLEGQKSDEPATDVKAIVEAETLEPADLSEEAGAVLDSSVGMLSEALYIVREHNFLAELDAVLDDHGIEVKEEVPESGP